MAWLPERLPGREAILWSKRMSSQALAGVAATSEEVIVADRDPADRVDVFRCYDADGNDRWTLRYPAPGKLDYGNSSRSTPLIHGQWVFLSGALGHLHAVEISTGKVRWKKNLQRDFGGPADLPWGFCGSPLVVEDRLIVQPGGPEASIVALDPATGDVLWKTPGRPPGHCSFVAATFGGRKQIVGYDDESLGGWDVATGERLWTVLPELTGDFNVPTPIVFGDKLIVATENNGTRVFGFDAGGNIEPAPLAANESLLPDCHSPVLVGTRLFGATGGLFCLEAAEGLHDVWRAGGDEFKEFNDYLTLIGGTERVLAATLHGKLILFSALGDRFEALSEVSLFDGEAGLYSHPAIVGKRLFVRGSKALVCLDLSGGDR